MKPSSRAALIIFVAAFWQQSIAEATPEEIAKKAQETIIQTLEFKNVSAAEALNVVSEATGMKVFYKPASTATPKINLTLTNIPTSGVLKFVTELANLKFRYESDGVHVLPQTAEFGPLKPLATEPLK
jgi:hypothetical protein